MNMPGFTAETSLGNNREHYHKQCLASNSSPGKEAVILAFRVTCGRNIALGATCTALGGGAAFFPCFWNSGCMWFHAGLAFPPCLGCSFV